MNNTSSPTAPGEKSGFTLRAAVIAAGLSLFLLASSSYVAIKIGAMPWPVIFSVIVAGGILRLRGRHVHVHEINVAQAGASVGGLVASGIVFTIPGIMFLNSTQNASIAWPNAWILALITVAAGVLGVALSVPLKKTFVDQENLPYPAGMAGAELLLLGKQGGKMLLAIIAIGAAAGIFALLRELYFPAGLTLAALSAFGVFLTFYPMPLAVSGGYILGAKAGFSWLGGAMLGWLLIIPLLVNQGSTSAAAIAWAQNLGMGMVLGSGLGFFVSYIIPRFKAIFLPLLQSNRSYSILLPVVSVLSAFSLIVAGVPWLAAGLAVIGVWIMVAVAARMTGETNIDPLEQFGIFTGLVIAFVYSSLALPLSAFASFMIVAFVSVACAVAGDIGHDYKSAQIVGTRFMDIVKVDLIAVICAGIAAPFVLELIKKSFASQLFTPLMPAPQARLVASSIFGFQYPRVFLTGLGLAFLCEIANAFLPGKHRNKVLLMPLGIGLFLGMGLALPMAIGAAIRVLMDKKYPHAYHTALLIAAGVMGGEGIAGFTAGALTTIGLPYAHGAYVLLALLIAVGGIAFWKYRE
ncbi:MAG: OPT/YSL family transporter [bacterium]